MKKITTRFPHKVQHLANAIALTLALGNAPALWADQSVSYTYDDKGNVLTEDGPRVDVQDITTHTYNPDGTRATTTNALGHVTRYNAYDGAGRLLSVTDPNGVTTEFTYHVRGWVETVTVKHLSNSSLNATTHYEYDAVGQLIKVTAPDGVVTHFDYTDARQLKAVYNDAGERIEYELDLAGNRKSQKITNSAGAITFSLARTYDELSRVMDITGNNGQNTHIQYDVNNNPTVQTSAKQHTTEQRYDALDRVKKVIDPALKETNYTYDAQGNIKTVTDARGKVTQYDYDAFGNLKTLTSPDTGVTQYTYDEAGNLKTRTDADGRYAEYQYDALNRVTQINYPSSPQENVTFEYDSLAQDTYDGTDWVQNRGVGRLTTRWDTAGMHMYGYDYQGRLVTQSASMEDPGQAYSSDLTVFYQYDLAGKLTKITYPSNRVVNYSYNSQGRVNLITTQTNVNAAPVTLFSQAEYLPFGPLNRFSFGNGIQAIYEYDTDYRLSSIKTQGPFAVLDQVFGYDLADNLNTWKNNLNTPQNQTFEYDPLNRLKTAQSNYGSVLFNYDEVGNRLQKTLTQNGTVQEDTYRIAADSNRLTGVTTRINTPNGSVTNRSKIYAYDAAGNRTYAADSGVATSTEFNEAGRLYYAASQDSADYRVNAQGQREQKTLWRGTSMQREHYTYSPQGELLAVSNGVGYAYMEVVYLEGKPLVAFMPPNPGLGLYASMSDKILNPGDSIYIDGFGSGGVSNDYEYRISVKDVSTNTTTLIKDWSAVNYTNWMVPDAVGKGFTLSVAIRNKGGTATRTATLIRDTSTFSSVFTVQAPLSISSTLSRSQAQPGQSITLSAQVSGGVSGEAYTYRFYTSVGGKSVVLSEGAATSATYTIPADTTVASQIFYVSVKQASASIWVSNTHKLTITTPATNTPAVVNGVRKQNGGYAERYVVNGSVATQPFYVHTDHLGTPRALTDASGKMVWSWHSEPFGETAPNEDPDADGKKVTFNLRFPGQYFDVETGLFYNYFRDYDALAGRYVESDPIGLEGGINTYGYVSGNVLNASDLHGLWSTQAHNSIINYTFRGLSPGLIKSIQRGSAKTDAIANQFGPTSFMHAMRDPGQPVEDAKAKACNFIRKNLSVYRQWKNGNTPRIRNMAYEALGAALHPVMDSTSPAHIGWEEWSPLENPWQILLHGNNHLTVEDLEALTENMLEANVKAIEKTLTNDECGCTM